MPMAGPGFKMELHLDLQYGWQRLKHLSHHLLPPRMLWQEAEPEVEELGFQRATPIQKTDILNDALTVYHSTCPCCPGKMGLED